MTGIILQPIKEAGAFFITTALSCGPSQLFGCVKLIIDSCSILASNSRKNKINSNFKKIEKDWDSFKTSPTAKLIAKKLGIESNNLTQQAVTEYFNTKNKKIEAKIKKLFRSIGADTCALIPLLGAHISWRIATGYKGKSFTPIFSRSIEQLLENCKTMASAPLFLGRKSKAENKSEIYGKCIEVSTSTRKRKIKIYHQLAKVLDDKGHFIHDPDRKKAPTVVLFHPNMGGAAAMSRNAELYRQKGYNTLAVTFGGYPGSPGVTTSEKSMYQDVEAIKRYLADMGVTEVAYHGFSLGSGAALQAATGESLVKNLETMFVVLDQPYASVAAVGANVAGPLGKGFMSAGCPVGLDVELPGGLWTKTDGLDNLGKVTRLKEQNIPLICFETDGDALMGRKKRNGKYTENFARDLLNARYGDAPDQTKNLVTLAGKHGFNSLGFGELWDNNIIPSLPNKS